ncbi:PREDICTED: tissue alpha-L-fucosidase-like, partial [Rhagoletis zephyria]|uniref:tissue alpha-L-fucosidase-like n=1 Tax=Rhagoletis zephyria TaxID=28612 RepID=UPI000811994A
TTAAHYEANWKSIDSRPLPSWFDKAKVGIFLHWGVFSVPSFNNEWFWYNWRTQKSANYEAFMKKNYKPGFTYEEFAPQLTAEFYEPEKWADLFKKAGAKYVVLTSKHHEGYTMWPSKYSFSWNVMDVGPKRDLLGDLATAVRHHNLTFGLYHSLYEWYNPMYLADKKNGFKTTDFVSKKIRPEMEEVVKMYKPSVIWSDGDWEASDAYWNSTDFLAWLYNESPVKDEVVVNDRWGSGTSCKHGGFFNCADRYFPGTLLPHKWENAMTIDKHSWGYRREAPLADYQTPEELIATVVKTVSCGGNVLINVGPTKDGKIVPIFEERLLQLGAWLGVNGQAIYESKPWTHQNDTLTQGVWYTQREGKVYGIATAFPSSESIEFGAVQFSTVKSVSLLGYAHSSLAFVKADKGHTKVTLPHLTPLMPVKYAYTFEFEL